MKKCVVVSDSFKGSLGSIEICNIAQTSIRSFFPSCEVVLLPVADGGEGTVECFLQACDGEKVVVDAKGPWGEDIKAKYATIGDTAIIEMAECAGLPMVGDNKNPSLTSTFGVGQLIKHAIENGARNVIIGLGGSCTNDGGCGCACALGVKFYNAYNEEFIPVGANLSQIDRIDIKDAKELLKDCEITAMCDIQNPMFGLNGAAYIFGPQKGADDEMVVMLDNQLKALDKAMQKNLGISSIANIPGAGAAGAMGAGVMAFLGAQLKSGIETVLDIVQFDERIKNADFVFTGEGKIDSQSLEGKVVYGVAKRAKIQNIPVIAIVGDVADDAYSMYDIGVSAIFSINRLAIPFSHAKLRSKQDYIRTFEDILRLINVAK